MDDVILVDVFNVCLCVLWELMILSRCRRAYGGIPSRRLKLLSRVFFHRNIDIRVVVRRVNSTDGGVHKVDQLRALILDLTDKVIVIFLGVALGLVWMIIVPAMIAKLGAASRGKSRHDGI